MSGRYLRTKEAAKHCNSTQSSFEKRRVLGGGPPFIKMGKIVVYDLSDLDEWMAERRFRSTAEADAARQADG